MYALMMEGKKTTNRCGDPMLSGFMRVPLYVADFPFCKMVDDAGWFERVFQIYDVQSAFSMGVHVSWGWCELR